MDTPDTKDQEQTVGAETTVMREVEGQTLVPTAIPMAMIGGIVAAIAGGTAWGLIVKLTDYEIGYMAVGVGLLCGFGVLFFSGRKQGPAYQACAIVTSILGIAIGKYASIYFVLQGVIAKENPELVGTISFFSADFFRMGTELLKASFHPLDILWIILAVLAANGITKKK